MALPAASGTLTAIHARGSDTRASCRALGTRRAADSRGLFSLCWHGQCRRGHAPFLSYLLPRRVHDAHRRAVPVMMDGNARTLIALKGHHGLVQMRVLARGRFHNGCGLRGGGLAGSYLVLRHRCSVLRGTRIIRGTRRTGGLVSNHRNLGGNDLLDRRRFGRTGHRGQAGLLAQTRGHSVGRILLRHLPRTDSIRVRRPGPHNSSISNQLSVSRQSYALVTAKATGLVDTERLTQTSHVARCLHVVLG